MMESLFNTFANLMSEILLNERLHHGNFSMKKFYQKNTFLTAEAVVRRCSKKGVLRNFSNRPQACNFIKKDSLAQVFSCQFFEISKNTFFYRIPPVAASVTGHFWATASDT